MTDSRNEKFVLNAQGVSNCLFFDEDGDLLLSKSLNMYILLLLLWYISKVGVLGESLMAVKKDYKISRVVMVITRKILNLLRVAGGHE